MPQQTQKQEVLRLTQEPGFGTQKEGTDCVFYLQKDTSHQQIASLPSKTQM